MKKFSDQLIRIDPWLEPFAEAIKWRYQRFVDELEQIEVDFGGLKAMSQGDSYFGFNPGKNDGVAGVWYREWAPGALSLALIGEFNDWERFRHPMKRDEYGVWSVFVPDRKNGLELGQKVKVFVAGKDGSMRDRLPAYIKKIERDGDGFVGVYWQPGEYTFKHKSPETPKNPRIYETHIGMAQEKEGVGSYDEFRKEVLPRIKKQGYNMLQLMAIAHHPLYSSFGYQVSSYFAPSSYLGAPEELMRLIDEAHRMGLVVLMDVVHSHSVKNLDDGLNLFDGTEHQYFHSGQRGEHPGWDTKMFDYGKCEVLRFLLSNVAYWMREYRFDGFRFDGVTAMLYHDRGLGEPFDNYGRYFAAKSVDDEAITYLQLANALIHQIKPDAVTIAEDVSGMPGLTRPTEEGGLGFDYRLAMGIPDAWIRLLKHKKDEDWRLGDVYANLVNRRRGEKHISYAESHDQALVGDKTIAFWLMDRDMYDSMHQDYVNPVVERGVAMHKMIRLLTFAAGGEGWLNFMGNEFGHPEWVDFPREGNNHSYYYARRQWSLVDHPDLIYRFLNEFDRALHRLDEEINLLDEGIQDLVLHDDKRRLLAFLRGRHVLVFNFSHDKSHVDLEIPVPEARDYRLVLTSDDTRFAGTGRVKSGEVYGFVDKPVDKRAGVVKLYLPSRSASVISPIE